MTKKVTISYKLCENLMNALSDIAFVLTKDVEQSANYAENRFISLMNEWEEKNNFEFDIQEEIEENPSKSDDDYSYFSYNPFTEK